MQLVHRGLHPVAAPTLAELRKTELGEPVRRELGAEVAPALVRVAHARDQFGKDAVVEPRGRDDDALLVEPGRVRGEAAGLPRADVGMVRA